MPRLRKPGINVAHGKQRERVAFEPRAENGCCIVIPGAVWMCWRALLWVVRGFVPEVPTP